MSIQARPFSDYIPESELKDLFERAIAEDGARDDITSRLTISKNLQGIGRIMAKQPLVLAGLDAATHFFTLFEPSMEVSHSAQDGQKVAGGDFVATIRGSVRVLLAVERCALNLLQHLCGIATFTALFVDQTRGTDAKILDTRKTIPGLRRLTKYAVHCGGGNNHRIGLSDAVLIKDNHIAAAGGVGQAVRQIHETSDRKRFVEVEVSDLSQLHSAMEANADRALLDNMNLDLLRRCVLAAKGRIELEASGGVTINSVRQIAQTGVDFISVGALTHSAPAADLNMKIVPLP